jgi:hypothetical protein
MRHFIPVSSLHRVLVVCAVLVAGGAFLGLRPITGPEERTIIHHNEYGTMFVWRLRGDEVLGLTTYGVAVSGGTRSLVAENLPLTKPSEEKK